jgi:hypothetical protein
MEIRHRLMPYSRAAAPGNGLPPGGSQHDLEHQDRSGQAAGKQRHNSQQQVAQGDANTEQEHAE